MTSFSDAFMADSKNLEYLKSAMMGPNAIRLAEEMCQVMPVTTGMRILDLGCGRGLSSYYLVKQFNAQVFAADLWISPTDNYRLFQELGIDDVVIPLSVDAEKGLPFASDYFDALLCVDAYHYFGRTPSMLSSLMSFVKKGGYIAVSVPVWKKEYEDEMPEPFRECFSEEDSQTVQTLEWWRELWSGVDGFELVACEKMACTEQAWQEYFTSPDPVAVQGKEMQEDKYFDFIQLVGKVL